MNNFLSIFNLPEKRGTYTATQMVTLQGIADRVPIAISTYNMESRLVELVFTDGQADVSQLPPGINLTRVQTEQGIGQQKWVKLGD